jgi:hypothetical protein
MRRLRARRRPPASVGRRSARMPIDLVLSMLFAGRPTGRLGRNLLREGRMLARTDRRWPTDLPAGTILVRAR